MGTAYDSVLELLDGQRTIYIELLDISKQKQTELVKGSLETLDSLTKREEALIFQAGHLEDERFCFTKELIEANGLEADASLYDIFQSAPAGLRERMEEIRSGLLAVLGELDKFNRENISLIRQSLSILNNTIEAISRDPAVTYSAGEGKTGQKRSVLVDKKV